MRCTGRDYRRESAGSGPDCQDSPGRLDCRRCQPSPGDVHVCIPQASAGARRRDRGRRAGGGRRGGHALDRDIAREPDVPARRRPGPRRGGDDRGRRDNRRRAGRQGRDPLHPRRLHRHRQSHAGTGRRRGPRRGPSRAVPVPGVRPARGAGGLPRPRLRPLRRADGRGLGIRARSRRRRFPGPRQQPHRGPRLLGTDGTSIVPRRSSVRPGTVASTG